MHDYKSLARHFQLRLNRKIENRKIENGNGNSKRQAKANAKTENRKVNKPKRSLRQLADLYGKATPAKRPKALFYFQFSIFSFSILYFRDWWSERFFGLFLLRYPINFCADAGVRAAPLNTMSSAVIFFP